MKAQKITHYISTALFSIMLLMGAGMYFFNHPHVLAEFTRMGFPTWIIYPLGVLKILGVVALWIPTVPRVLKEWAYAGFFFNLLLAIFAHLATKDGEFVGAAIALVLLLASRITLIALEKK